MSNETNIAREIAAEDIQPGQYIAKLHKRNTCALCEELGEEWKKPRKWELPWDVDPQLVKAVCLPYILAVDADGDPETLDVRGHRFALLPESFGRVPFDLKKEKERREKEENDKEPKKEASERDSS